MGAVPFGWRPADGEAAIDPRPSVRDGRELVLRLRFEVAGIVPLVELIRGIAAQPVDFAAALYRRASADHRRPALQMLIILHLQEFGAAILVVLRQAAIPRPDRDVGDRIGIAGDVFAFR